MEPGGENQYTQGLPGLVQLSMILEVPPAK